MTNTYSKLSPEKQKAILDAAAHVFASKGYHHANVADICIKANISVGSLYQYFSSKKNLYIKVISSYVERLSHSFDHFSKTLEAGDFSFKDVIKELVEMIPDLVERERDYLRIYHELGSASMDEFTAEISQEFIANNYRFWVEIVEKGKETGEIRPSISSDVAAYMINNHFTLFIFSCVSEHYAKRVNAFFGQPDENFSMEEKTSLMNRSIIQLLT